MNKSLAARLVPLIIIAMIGASWWYIVKTNRLNDKINADTVQLSSYEGTAKIETTPYKDSTGKYTLQYPKDWAIKRLDNSVHDLTSQPVTFTPPNAASENAVLVAPSYDGVDFYVSNWQKDKHIIKTTKINGSDVTYTNYTFKGDAEGFTDHIYLISKNGQTLIISYRSSYHHDNVVPPVTWDETKNLPGFTSIVRSIKLL